MVTWVGPDLTKQEGTPNAGYTRPTEAQPRNLSNSNILGLFFEHSAQGLNQQRRSYPE
jgi:hypothetical protein